MSRPERQNIFSTEEHTRNDEPRASERWLHAYTLSVYTTHTHRTFIPDASPLLRDCSLVLLLIDRAAFMD